MNIQFLISALVAAVIASSATAVQAENKHSTAEVAEPNVVIYRPNQRAMLSYMDYRLYLNGKSLGKLPHGERLELHLSPGSYQLMANDSAQSQLQFEVKTGKTTVVKAQVDSALCMPMKEMKPQLVAATKN
ncbi:hypothetical protein KFE80_05680 [bacterium SCSIO 12696]|nr:hypothetical protein KFE80_05680 [bacterium SCSIO 12696]